MQWKKQSGSIITKVITLNYHVDDSAKGRYDMILGRDILTTLGFNLEFSDPVIESDNGTFKGLTAPMFDLVTYEFKDKYR